MWIKELKIKKNRLNSIGYKKFNAVVLHCCLTVAFFLISLHTYAQQSQKKDTAKNIYSIKATDSTALEESNKGVYNKFQKSMSNKKWTERAFSLITRKPHFDTIIVAGTSVDEVYKPFEGKIINEIKIIVLPPFAYDIENPDTISHANWLEKIGNSTHMNTRQWVLRNNLLFDEGDPLNPYVMAETSAFLRSLDYINDVYIQIESIGDNEVDVTVVVKDNFSLGFYIRGGSSSKADVELFDRNFLGLGNNVSIRGIVNTKHDRKFGYGAGYKYPNLLRTFINLDASYVNDIASQSFAASVERPLQRTFNTFGQVSYKNFKSNLKYAVWDSISPTYNTEFSSSLGYAFKPLSNDHTLVLSARYIDRYPSFRNVEKEKNDEYFQYVKNHMVLMQLSLFKQRYYRNYLINSFGKPEDFAYGYNISAQIGFSRWSQFNQEGFYTSLKASMNKQFTIGSIYFEGSISSFFDKKGPFEGVLNLELNMFSPLYTMGNHSFRQFFNIDYTKRLNYLPNFRNYYLTFSEVASMDFHDLEKKSTATQRLMFKAESDFFSSLTVLGFRFLFYSFLDFGWIAGYDETLLNRHNIYWGTGVGVRIRNDLLVFRTLELKIGWYPRLDQSGFNNFVNANTSIPNISPNFRPKYPEEIPL